MNNLLIHYKLEFTIIAQEDMARMKRYILDTYKYKGLGKSFTLKMKEAIKIIKKSPTSFSKTFFSYRGYTIYFHEHKDYLFFYIVDKNQLITVIRVLHTGMDWEHIISRWIEMNPASNFSN